MTHLDALVQGAQALGLTLSPEQIGQFRAYLDGLAQWNERFNLTSPAALADAVRVHLLDSLTLAPIVRREAGEDARLVDVGSGAGFPGLALKVAMPHLRVVLVEATRKKAEFLQWTAGTLGLEDVEVVQDRAERLGHSGHYRGKFGVATARALGPLSTVLELTLPLCQDGGIVLAPRGNEAEMEAVAVTPVSRELGGGEPQVLDVPLAASNGRTSIVMVKKLSPTPPRYPRREGMPAKRPLR